MNDMKEEIKYCSNCWTQLVTKIIRADKIDIQFCSMWWDITIHPLWARYSEKNWKEQYWIILKCPNKKWYNFCNKYIDEEQKLFTK